MTKFTAKYDKAQIMRNAHKFYRDGRMGDFATCLRKAWARAKAVKATIEREVKEEAHTYGEFLAMGYEVIHGEHAVAKVIVDSVRYVKQVTETLAFFTWAQVCPVGMQADKQ